MPLQSPNWFYTESNNTLPQSTTHEMLERGREKKLMCVVNPKKKFSFQDIWFDDSKKEKRIEATLTTSYRRDYITFTNIICPSATRNDDTIPDHLWNRKPLNDFALERSSSSEFKFMDDHLINVSPERQRVNYFRQIRNQHFSLG